MNQQSPLPSSLPLDTKPEVLSVTDVSLSLKRYVESGFRSVHIRGEISGYKRHTSGHAYFALKDNDSVIDAVAWRGTPIAVQPEDGLEVIIRGRITTYPGRSKYQVVVESLEAAGQGALMKILLERKERLEREGLFAHKRQLPAFPKRIGIITSPTSAVIRDILHRLEDRFPCDVLVWPAQVQGPGSIEQVAFAIRGMNVLDPSIRPDVLIVARGGGSLEDLWTFNEEAVVRAAAESTIPLISAIGHETDTTLIDYASDRRAPTPTAAAEFATPVRAQLLSSLGQISLNMHQLTIRQLRLEWMNLKGYVRGLPQPYYLIETLMQRLDDRVERLARAISYHLIGQQQRLKLLTVKHPAETLRLHQQNFDHLSARFTRAMIMSFKACEQTFNYLDARLTQSSYTKILEKGFAWTSIGDTVISSAAQFPDVADSVTLHFIDGTVTLKPNEITKKLDKLHL